MTDQPTTWTPPQPADLKDDDDPRCDCGTCMAIHRDAVARTFGAVAARGSEPAVVAVELTRESMWAAQMREQLARFGLRLDCSVAALVAVAQGKVPPGAAVDGAVRREFEDLRAEVANLRAAGHAVGRGHERERQRAITAEAERDDLRARLAALADEWDREYTTSNGVDSYMRAAAYKVRALASVPEPSDSEPHAPCCDACGGSGASDEASSNGLCWDCRGTGCAHEPSDSEPAPDADREAGER